MHVCASVVCACVCECGTCMCVCSYYCIPSGAQYFTYKGCLCQVREDTEQVTALKIKQEACNYEGEKNSN